MPFKNKAQYNYLMSHFHPRDWASLKKDENHALQIEETKTLDVCEQAKTGCEMEQEIWLQDSQKEET